MSQSNTPAIQLNNIRFGWDNSADLLTIPQLTVNRGEKIFIHGASGSGKSTLLGLLGGVYPPQQGQVLLNGSDLYQLSNSQRDHFRADHIGFIFQMFNLLPYLSVIENVILPCHFSTARKRKAIEASGSLTEHARLLLSHLGLDDKALLQRSVTQLSIGQQQRVAAARALMGSPEFIIADEPTSALDEDVQEKFLQLLIDECDNNQLTLLFVSHDNRLRSLFERQLSMNEINLSAKAKNPLNSEPSEVL